MKNRIKHTIKILILVFIIALFSGCHKKKKPLLLLPLVDNVSINDSNDSNVSSGGSGGSGGSSFTPARGELDTTFNGSGKVI